MQYPVMLDIGHEFLKMIEEDWGKKPRKLLSFLIGFFIAAFSLHFICEWLFIPIYHAVLYIRGHDNLYDLLKDRIVNIIISILIITALSLIVGYLFYSLCRNKIIILNKEVVELLRRAEKIEENGRNRLEQVGGMIKHATLLINEIESKTKK